VTISDSFLPDLDTLETGVPDPQVEQAAAEVLECSEAWRKGSATAKPASSILRLLGALDELPAAAMLNAAHAIEGQSSLLPVPASAAYIM